MSGNYLGFGALPSPKDIRDYKLKKNKKYTETSDSYFIAKNAVIKNQGLKPTCVAHALSEIIEYNYKKEIGEYEQFSTDFIYGLRDNSLYKENQEGMYLREGLSIIKDFGDVFYEDLPSNNFAITAKSQVKLREQELKQKAYSYRISSYYKITSLEELRYSLVHDGAVAGAMKWYKNYKLVNYTYKYDTNESFSCHAVIIIGWIGDKFIIQNSWGKSWGKSGLFLIHENDIFNLFFELYGVTDNIQSVKKPLKLVKKVAPFINFIINKTNLKNHDIK